MHCLSSWLALDQKSGASCSSPPPGQALLLRSKSFWEGGCSIRNSLSNTRPHKKKTGWVGGELAPGVRMGGRKAADVTALLARPLPASLPGALVRVVGN